MRSTSERGPKEVVKRAVRGMQAFPVWVHRLGYYGLALLFVAAAATLRRMLPGVLGPIPFLVFYLAWVGAAAFGGLGPGLLATVASWLCVELWFDFTPGRADFGDPMALARLTILMVGGLTVSLVAERMRRGRIREREQEQALREREQKYRRIVETATEAIAMADANARIVFANDRWSEILGYRLEEALRELTATLESKVAQRTAEVKHRVRQLQKLTLDMSEAEDRERIELLGGRMKIRSTLGKGSTFFIVVPNGELSESDGGGEPQLRDRAKDARRVRVLLADDHEIVREGLALLLSEESDVEVVGEASNGREAVTLTDRLEPDVVIMDVAMPLMSSDEATREIKQHRPDTRVVALSMFEDPDTAERMHAAGAEAYVLKTAPSEDLLAAIRGD